MPKEPYDVIVEALGEGVYTRLGLYDVIYRYFPSYASTSCDWVIGTLKGKGQLRSLGNGFYAKGKTTWRYEINQNQQKTLDKLMREFPNTQVSFINSQIVNEIVGNSGGMEWSFLAVDKRDLFPFYMRLRELTKKDIMLTPTAHELSYYLRPGAIILVPLFSKSPCEKNGLFSLEKLIVDFYADRVFLNMFPGAEFEEKLMQILRIYNVNIITTINYAKRRRVEDKIRLLFERATPEEYRRVTGGEDAL